jgi:flagellar biosynthetic protein FliP
MNPRLRKFFILGAVFALGLYFCPSLAHAQVGNGTVPIPVLQGVTNAKNPQQVAITLQVLALLTILSVAPGILIMMTAFTRIIIVLSFIRSAIGAQNIPPNQVLLGLALFLTFFIMAPTFDKMNHDSFQPYLSGKMEFPKALQLCEKPMAQFMIKQTYKDDLNLFLSLSNNPRPQSLDQLPLTILTPAFVISELKTGFIFGFIIYIPFVIIDLVVSSLLMSMGMMMLPPTTISLPAKVLVFILADGWHAIIGSLAQSYK